MSRTISTCLDCGKDTFWDLGSEPCRCYACQQRRDEAQREAGFAGAIGSAADTITSEVMRVVSPEGYDPEEWIQVRNAVLKGLENVQKPPNARSEPRRERDENKT